jgi:hypothetical protein
MGTSTSKVWLLNDDYTTMEFVVYVLEEESELEHEDAVRIILQTHEEGADQGASRRPGCQLRSETGETQRNETKIAQRGPLIGL